MAALVSNAGSQGTGSPELRPRVTQYGSSTPSTLLVAQGTGSPLLRSRFS